MNDYCVILSRQPFVNPAYPRTILAAADDNPHFRVMGVEHSDVYPPFPQGEPSRATSSVWQAA